MSNATKIMGELYSIYTQDREARRGGGGGAKRGGGVGEGMRWVLEKM